MQKLSLEPRLPFICLNFRYFPGPDFAGDREQLACVIVSLSSSTAGPGIISPVSLSALPRGLRCGPGRASSACHLHGSGSISRVPAPSRSHPCDPKSVKGRTIRLPLRTVEALKAHRARQAEEKLKAGPLYQDDGLVFATEVGTTLEPSNHRPAQLQAASEESGAAGHALARSAPPLVAT